LDLDSLAGVARPSGDSPRRPAGPPRRRTVLDLRDPRPTLQGPRIRVLHTSDWHLGRTLNRFPRDREFRDFLEWLLELLDSERVDVLVVAGDVFDVSMPPASAQKLYYDFLGRATSRPGRSVVVASGNHDSPNLLEAAKGLLKARRIHVSAVPAEDPASELLILDGPGGGPALIVAAVPFLREGDIRRVAEGESVQEAGRGIARGIAARYARTAGAVAALRRELGANLPALATGHLMVAGASYGEDDGLRTLYPGAGPGAGPDAPAGDDPPRAAGRPGDGHAGPPQGTAADVTAAPARSPGAGRLVPVGTLWGVDWRVFAEGFDYTALGHIHRPQQAGDPAVRYSGSPIPMRFDEASSPKSVVLAEIGGGGLVLETIEIPEFRELRRVSGDMEAIADAVAALRARDSDAFLEVWYTGTGTQTDLQGAVDSLVAGSRLEVACVRDRRPGTLSPGGTGDGGGRVSSLEELDVNQVFTMFLKRNVPEEEWGILRPAFEDIVREVEEAGAVGGAPAVQAGSGPAAGADAGDGARAPDPPAPPFPEPSGPASGKLPDDGDESPEGGGSDGSPEGDSDEEHVGPEAPAPETGEGDGGDPDGRGGPVGGEVTR
jgi:exonuclease SbcD